MNKEEIIKTVNAIKNTPIAPQKEKLTENSSGKKYKNLARYNAMLDNITFGMHTNTTIKLYGVEWKLRLLSYQEVIDIKISANQEAKLHEIFDDFFLNYHIMIKTVAKALTPSPFKTEGTAIFSEDDLRLINDNIILDIFKEYCHFADMATSRPTELTNEDVENIYNIVKKKPEILKELERSKLLAVTYYTLNYLSQTQKMLELGSNSSSS